MNFLLRRNISVIWIIAILIPSLVNSQNYITGIDDEELDKRLFEANTTQAPKHRNYGHGFYLTRSEEKQLDELRPLVEDYMYRPNMHGDNYLVKFLRARNHNVNDAAEMIKDMIAWRKTNRIDELLLEDLSRWEKLFPFIVSGEDKERRPIYYILASTYDIRKAVIAGQYNTLVKLYDQSYEKGMRLGQYIYDSTGKNAGLEGILIIDLTGFNVRQHACAGCLPIFVHVIQSYETYYPQSLYKMFMINAPRSFEVILNVVRPLMSTHTQKAFEVYGVDKNEWEPVLKKYITDDNLLVRYGGTRKLNKLSGITLGG